MSEATHEMKITALAPWFGGKRTMAPTIVRELGPHAAYWELFCGSMGVLLSKPACAMETVNDLHADLTNLARVIKDPVLGPKLYRRLRRWLAATPLLNDAAEMMKTYARGPSATPDIDRAEAYFVASWLGRNGVAGTQSYNQGFSRRFTKNGGHAARRWVSAVESIPQWRERMRNVSILSECGIGLVSRGKDGAQGVEDAKGVSLYADPPYVVKGASYVHDFSEEDHVRLASALHRYKRTRVVVSYYEHPMVRELYKGWTFVNCAMAKALVNQGQRDNGVSAVAPEILIINGPSFCGGGLWS